ncbi:dormancy-associated protein homolog 4-like isoform X2 [Mangifera indica]|uniref:dormancy-associated protein homolog 4-like isoform X2 n=1 Tax=Mangifera indica TaxID=29780 RepID=UPI001CF98F5E|nr:dormancy-associated protein homolog 4-like isoform X2 [Mangifera indica]
MGFLHKIWDETLAGPAPETGLGKLRKYHSFSGTRSQLSPAVNGADDVVVTRSIMILKSNSNFRSLSLDPGSASESPAVPPTPRTPLSPGTLGGDFKKFTRRRTSTEALEREAEPRRSS